MFNIAKSSGSAKEIMDILERRMIKLDKKLNCVGMTLNVGEDSKGRGVYRIERDEENDMTKIMEIVASVANGTLVEKVMFDATITRTGEPSIDLQALSNAISVFECMADGIVKMFMVVAAEAVKDQDIVNRMLAVNENISSAILEALAEAEAEAEAAEKEEKEERLRGAGIESIINGNVSSDEYNVSISKNLTAPEIPLIFTSFKADVSVV